jgi:putative ABC transport system permease protein
MYPLLGRTFTAREEASGGPGAAVISYRLWTRRYAQDPGVLSRRLLIGGNALSIVGVMPKNFTSAATDVWIPAQAGEFLLRQRDARFMSGVGRLQPGFTIDRARADLAAVQNALGEQFPATDKGWSVSLKDLKDTRIGDSGQALLLLFGSVALLLFITVTNVAGLVLSQFHQREREIAIRASIGATRGQVVGSLMREVALIAIAGALGGWSLAAISMRLLSKLFAQVPRIADLQMDWRAFAFAAGVSVFAALGFGLFPAIRATGAQYAAVVMRGGRGVVGRRQILQRLLVAGQIALTMVLLAGAGLLLRSFYNLSHVDMGFRSDHVLVFHVGAAWDEDRTRIGRMQEDLLAGLRQLPGVEAAGITNFLPASGATLRYQVVLEGAAGTEETAKMPAGSRTVSPGYLKALQAPLLSGSFCPELRLDPHAQPKVMVNRRFVEVYAHGGNVVGRRLDLVEFRTTQPREIVGVLGDIKEDGSSMPAYPYVYHCAAGGNWPDPEYTIRASGNPRALLGGIRQVVHNVDANRAIFGVQLLDDALDAAIERPRSDARLLLAFALTALLLSAVGLYSLVSQIVNARRQEIGVRIALGAEPRAVVRSLVAGAARLIAGGMLAGLGLALLAARLLSSLLFGVGALDAVSVTAAAVLLGGVSMVAAFLPARTAAAVDPMETMRSE